MGGRTRKHDWLVRYHKDTEWVQGWPFSGFEMGMESF